MRSVVALLTVVVLVGLTTAGHSKNKPLLDAVQKRMASLSHQAKRLFVKGEGEHAVWQKLAAGAGLALITCTSMSCGVALRGVAQEQQYVRSPEMRDLLIEAHPDEDRGVVIASDEEGKQYLYGLVASVYDNDSYEVMVGAYMDHDNNLRKVESPYMTIVSSEDILEPAFNTQTTSSAPSGPHPFIWFIFLLLLFA